MGTNHVGNYPTKLFSVQIQPGKRLNGTQCGSCSSNWQLVQERKDISIYDVLTFLCIWLNATVNNFAVMLGRSHRCLGITSTLGGRGKYVLLKHT